MIRARLFSLGYTAFRNWVIEQTYAEQRRRKQPIDLETVVEKGDRIIKLTQLFLSPLLYSFRIPRGISVGLYDLYFPSPLTIAAFKDDLQILSFWANFGTGGCTIKTMMPHPREGNARPRLQEVSLQGMDGLINAMGLPGKGVEKMISQLEKSSLLKYQRPIGLSLGGHSIDDYLSTFRSYNNFIKGKTIPHYFEINISCPNTADGQDMLKDPQLLESLLSQMRKETDSTIGVKLSPDQPNTQLLLFGELIRGHSKMFINIGNTQYKTCDQVGLATNSIAIGGGGYSGAGLFPRTLEMVKLLSDIHVPLMATGGVSNIHQVEALLDHGATLIGMATALVKNPYCVPIINHRLASQTRRMLK